jgi:hypothetical protein
VILLACTAAQIRSVTYPPDFHYITRSEVRGVMDELAVRMTELESLMQGEAQDDFALDSEQKARVASLLSEMKGFARELDSGTRTNHPDIDRYAPELRDDLERALRGVNAIPPNYYYAGQISGSCEYCHAPRHK